MSGVRDDKNNLGDSLDPQRYQRVHGNIIYQQLNVREISLFALSIY